jgi:serine protease DegS
MNIRDSLSYFSKAAVIGLFVAMLLWFIQPDWLTADSRQLDIKQAPIHDPADQSTRAAPASYADAVEPAARAVVNIFTAKVITRQRHPLLDDPVFRHFFGEQLQAPRKRLQTSLGSGVIISDQGYILTNNHVIAGADEIQVQLNDGRSAKASVVGMDKDTDLAVLQIKLEDLPVIQIANKANLRVGDVALAIGNPYGVGQTVTLGIISATGRNQLGINRFEDFIQTDAAINPGNSGGALINAYGELIGINTAIYSRSGGSQGIGFAIPAYLASDVTKQLVEQGHVERGWLGIEAQDLTPELANSFGLSDTRGILIAGVLRGGPADQAGIEPGDIIQTINGRDVVSSRSAMNYIAQSRPDTTLQIQGIRNGKPLKLKVRTALRPDTVNER